MTEIKKVTLTYKEDKTPEALIFLQGGEIISLENYLSLRVGEGASIEEAQDEVDFACGGRLRLNPQIEPQNTTEESQSDLQTFPSWVMDGAAGDFANLYSSYLESPSQFFYFAFLTCLGSVISDRVTLDLEIRPQPRFYTILIGESADDRKSTAAEATIQFYRTTLMDGFNVCYGVGSAEGLQQKLVEHTPSRLILFFDEFKTFVNKCGIEASVLLPCVNTLYESNRYESHTKGSSIKLDDSYLSILGATTKATFAAMWRSAFTDIGFNNRLFLVPGSGKRKFAMPQTIPDSLKYEIKRNLARMVTEVMNGKIFDVSTEGRQIFEAWYLNLEQSIHSKRIDGLALRFMPLLALNEGKETVDASIVKKAIALADWQLAVRRELDPIDADNVVARMEESIRRQLRKRPMTNRELKQHTAANRTGTWIFETALKNLQKAQDVFWNRADNKWRV